MRNPYEQQEYQRNNPHLFTTMSTEVSADGSLITFDEVTASIRKQLDKLEELHGGMPYWFVFGTPEEKDMLDYLNRQLVLVQRGFVENYRRVSSLRSQQEATDEH